MEDAFWLTFAMHWGFQMLLAKWYIDFDIAHKSMALQQLLMLK